MRPVRRSLATVAVAPLLALALVACGGDSGDSEADGASTPASQAGGGVGGGVGSGVGALEGGPEFDAGPDSGPDTTPESDGPSTGETDDKTPPDLPEGEAVDVDQFAEIVRAGMESVTTANVDVLVDIEGEGGEGTGVLDVTGDRDALKLDLADRGSSERATIYMIDDVIFLKEDATSQDKFIKLTPEHHDGLSLYSLFHPHQLTDLFLDEARSVAHLGSEGAGGEAVEHYRMEVDPKAFDKVLRGLLPPGDALTVVQQQIWLDANARLVKTEVELAEGDETFVIEMSLGDFGGPAPVEEPPASQVDDLSRFRGE